MNHINMIERITIKKKLPKWWRQLYGFLPLICIKCNIHYTHITHWTMKVMNRNHSLCIVAIRCFIRTILWRQTMFGFWLSRLSSWCRIRRIKTVYLCLHQTHNNTRNIIFLIILENGVIYFNATLWRAINKNWPLADCLPLTQQTNYILFLCLSFYVLCVELKRSHFGCVYFWRNSQNSPENKHVVLLCCCSQRCSHWTNDHWAISFYWNTHETHCFFFLVVSFCEYGHCYHLSPQYAFGNECVR